ncbi:hypothetical protein Dip510_000958 [Elusimicrobium posterum]|uniref:hypothetical protein n=1 Tax=Elusimicrobium posterum TaxID=3116653 RepID=UPI003C7388C1
MKKYLFLFSVLFSFTLSSFAQQTAVNTEKQTLINAPLPAAETKTPAKKNPKPKTAEKKEETQQRPVKRCNGRSYPDANDLCVQIIPALHDYKYFIKITNKYGDVMYNKLLGGEYKDYNNISIEPTSFVPDNNEATLVWVFKKQGLHTETAEFFVFRKDKLAGTDFCYPGGRGCNGQTTNFMGGMGYDPDGDNVAKSTYIWLVALGNKSTGITEFWNEKDGLVNIKYRDSKPIREGEYAQTYEFTPSMNGEQILIGDF